MKAKKGVGKRSGSPLALSLANSVIEFDGSEVTGDRRGFRGLTLLVVSQTLPMLGKH